MAKKRPSKPDSPYSDAFLGGLLLAVGSLIAVLFNLYKELQHRLEYANFSTGDWNEIMGRFISLFMHLSIVFLIILLLYLVVRILNRENPKGTYKIMKSLEFFFDNKLFTVFLSPIFTYLPIIFFVFLITFSLLIFPGLHAVFLLVSVGNWGYILILFNVLPFATELFLNKGNPKNLLSKKSDIFKSWIKNMGTILLILATILFIFLFSLIIIIFLKLPDPYFWTVILIALSSFSFATRKKWNLGKWTAWGIMGVSSVFLLILIFHVIANTVLYFGADFEISLDEHHYFENEDVFLKVYPSGIFKPRLQEVFYSNDTILLLNRTGEEFQRTPAYVKINSSILVTKPENSFIVLKYKFGSSCLSFLPIPKIEPLCYLYPDPPATHRIHYIPVFPGERKPEREAGTRDRKHFLN